MPARPEPTPEGEGDDYEPEQELVVKHKAGPPCIGMQRWAHAVGAPRHDRGRVGFWYGRIVSGHCGVTVCLQTDWQEKRRKTCFCKSCAFNALYGGSDEIRTRDLCRDRAFKAVISDTLL